MYLTSGYAGYGRNFWVSIHNGRITARDKDEDLYVRVKNGLIVEQIIRRKDECTTLRYGQGCRTKKGGKTVKEEHFEPGTLQAIKRGSLWKRQTGISLCGAKGVVECFSTSGGAYSKEVFRYDNGVPGYVATRWKNSLEVKRPNGKLWIVVKGKIFFNREPLAEKLDPDSSELNLWSVMRKPNWEITVYDKSGIKVVTKGCIKNRQKDGKWLQDGKVSYYMSGVQVSQQLCEDDPDKWNPYEVLAIPNAQLRCSLLNKMGYDRLLDKVNCSVKDNSSDGGQLVEINTGIAEGPSGGLDRLMRLLKVICPSTGQVYVLRVPPGIESYEQARQWTFGLRQASIREGAQFELVAET
jgi:hypothetical protein